MRMPDVAKKRFISFVGDKPVQVVDQTDKNISVLTPDQQQTISLIGKVISAYKKAAKSLLNEKYSHLREFVPTHLADPGNIVAACCTDGVVIRYEKNLESPKTISIWMQKDLSQIAAILSQSLIQCHPNQQFTSTVETTGAEVTLSAVSPSRNKSKDLFSTRIGFDVVIDRPEHAPLPPQKPFCLASVRNALEIGLKAELVEDGEKSGKGQHILIRNELRLPVGWECIEIYPYIDLEAWKPEYAPIWAENDLLAAVVAAQVRESHFESLDPNAKAREKYAAILKDFKNLLDSNPGREEILQIFLRNHPFLLCPTHTKIWPKLPLGAKVTDFVFRDATSDYLLVELEKSTHPLFRDDGHVGEKVNIAIGQITDWKRYLEDNLRTVQQELGLTGISADPQSLAVIGRSHTLTAENRRKLGAMNSTHPKLKIMTYDNVYDNAKAVIENLLGPIWHSSGETQIYHLTKT